MSIFEATALTASFAPLPFAASFPSANTSTSPSIVMFDSTPVTPFIDLITATFVLWFPFARTFSTLSSRLPPPFWMWIAPPPLTKSAAVCPPAVLSASIEMAPAFLTLTFEFFPIAVMPVVLTSVTVLIARFLPFKSTSRVFPLLALDTAALILFIHAPAEIRFLPVVMVESFVKAYVPSSLRTPAFIYVASASSPVMAAVNSVFICDAGRSTAGV